MRSPETNGASIAADTTSVPQPTFAEVDTTDIAQMGYEEAREELEKTVAALEAPGTALDESLRLWERGEALSQHCSRWLDAASQRIEDKQEKAP